MSDYVTVKISVLNLHAERALELLGDEPAVRHSLEEDGVGLTCLEFHEIRNGNVHSEELLADGKIPYDKWVESLESEPAGQDMIRFDSNGEKFERWVEGGFDEVVTLSALREALEAGTVEQLVSDRVAHNDSFAWSRQLEVLKNGLTPLEDSPQP